MLLENIILDCAEKFNRKRTDSAIFHLLTGRKSTQTLQDIHLFQLRNYYGIYPTLKRNQFNKLMGNLINRQSITINNSNIIEYLYPKLNNNYHEIKAYFSGLDYIQVSNTFYHRLLILIQVYTNKLKNSKRYIPVIDQQAILTWVKAYIKQSNQEPRQVLNSLYLEMKTLLKQINTIFANIFVDRLTSYKRYGLSEAQLSSKYDVPLIDIPLIITATTQRILKSLLEDPTEYEVLYSLMTGLTVKSFMTKSAEQTYLLWQQGKNIQEIVRMRKIKENTVFDHFIEIALNTSNFPIDQFVSIKQQQEIIKVINATQTKKLKDIKQQIHPDITYFQISLTLARINYLT